MLNVGYRVLSVAPGSPLGNVGLVPMLDFLVYPDPEGPEQQGHSFGDMLASNLNRSITLSVFNMASQQIRKVTFTPRKWQGEGLLGLEVRPENYATASQRVIRVLSAPSNSPALMAGFIPEQDYIVAAGTKVFADLGEFVSFVRAHNHQPIDFQVYNNSSGLRKVTATPNSDWGNRGLLGGSFGSGMRHSLSSGLPPPPRNPAVKAIQEEDKDNGPEATNTGSLLLGPGRAGIQDE